MSIGSWTRRTAGAVAQDARFGSRILRRAPLATTIMVASTAIGVGVTTAVFTLADVMLFRPLPFPNAERLVVPYQTVTVRSQARQDTINWTFAQYELLRRTVAPFDDAGFATWTDAIARPIDDERPVRIEAITTSMLSTFSIRAQRGDAFSATNDASDAPTTVAMISDRFWKSAYGGSNTVVGTTLLINRTPVTIVGIMPRGFSGFAIGADIWLPIRMMSRIEPSARWTERLANQTGTVIARASAGVPIAKLSKYLEAAYPIVNQIATGRFVAETVNRGVGVTTLAESRRHPLVRPMLELMGVAVGVLLLIVCANIASILLARGYARRHETGVRIVMGASRSRVRVAALIESSLLGLLGLPLGILVSYWCAEAVGTLRPPLPQNWVLLRGTDLLAGVSLAPNLRVMGFAAVITVVSTLLFGIGPAVVQSRIDAARLITSGGTINTSAPVRGRQLLVVSQVSLATLLLVAAVLMTESLRALLNTDLGFQGEGVVAIRLASTDTSASARVRRADFFANLAKIPGVSGVTISACEPFDLSCIVSATVHALDRVDGAARPTEIDMHSITSDYFRVMRIPMIAGRTLAAEDTTVGMGHLIISEGAARRLFGSAEAAVNKAIAFEGNTARPMTIVGVVRDVRFRSVEGTPSPAVYYLAGEDPSATRYQTTAFVRTTLGDGAAIGVIGRELRSTGAPISMSSARSLTDTVRDATASTRFVALLLIGFATAALVLAALGVYGVISYIIAQRTREMGIRLVLGADVDDLSRGMVGHGAALVANGIGVGLALALAASRTLSALVFEVKTFDVVMLLTVAAVVAVIGLAATLASTFRIRRIDALRALRV